MTQVVENSGDRIRLYSRPSLWAVGLFGAIFLAMLFGLCPSHELECRRAKDGTVQVKVKRQLVGFTLSERAIAGVTAAMVQQSPDSSSGRTMSRTPRGGVTVEHDDTSRITFDTPSGPVPLTKTYYAGRAGFQQAADQLNQFIQATSPDNRRIPVPTNWIQLRNRAGRRPARIPPTSSGNWKHCDAASPDSIRFRDAPVWIAGFAGSLAYFRESRHCPVTP